MIEDLYSENKKLKWFLIHLLLGYSCIFFSQIIIIWFYSFLIISLHKIISDYILRGSSFYLLPLIIYLSSFEVFARILKSGPYIPWELSKYLFSFTFIFYLLTTKIKFKKPIGFLMILILIPGSIIDLSNRVSFGLLVYNLMGPLSIAFLLIILGKTRINENHFNSYLRSLWYSSITMLVYVTILTPNISTLNFSLNANFQATAGFGSNQVSTILGIGMFLSFYAWMNKKEFSNSHRIDGLFIALFAYQGFLSFSRGGMVVGLFCILIYYIFLKLSKNYHAIAKNRKLKPTTFFGIGLFFVFGSYLLINIISEGNINDRYLGETQKTLDGEAVRTLNSMTTGRYELVKSDFKLWGKNFIFGTGVGASKFLRDSGISYAASHTEFSRLVAEHGIFGLFYILILFYFFIKMVFKTRKTVGNAILFSLFLIGIGTMMHSGMRTFVSPVFIAISSMIITTNDEDAIL